jgi:hypothetical protein
MNYSEHLKMVENIIDEQLRWQISCIEKTTAEEAAEEVDWEEVYFWAGIAIAEMDYTAGDWLEILEERPSLGFVEPEIKPVKNTVNNVLYNVMHEELREAAGQYIEKLREPSGALFVVTIASEFHPHKQI